MKTVKKDASSFKKLGATDMKKIDGGFWIKIPGPDGTVTPVWM